MRRVSIRAILDTIQEVPPCARELSASRELSVAGNADGPAIVVEEVVEEVVPIARHRTELDDLSDMKHFTSRNITDVMNYLGEFYFAARSNALWKADQDINLVDLQWLQCAQTLVRRLRSQNAQMAPPPKTPNLLAGLRLALSITHFGDAALRHLDLEQQMRSKICTFWRAIESEPDPERSTKLTRMCTRFVSAVAFVRTHIVGKRTIRRHQALPSQLETWTGLLDNMIRTAAKDLPEMFHDEMQQEITLCMLPVDASNDYALESRKLGIYAGSAADRDTVVSYTEEIDTDRCAQLCTFVPWDRPDKPAVKPKPADMWLWECWQLQVFAYLFHSYHCRESGSFAASATNVLDAGLFGSRYVVTWWNLMQPHTLYKLQCRIRYHERALPLLLQAGNGSWWVRTPDELIVCSTLAAALFAWLHVVETAHAGTMEDGIRVNVRGFVSGLQSEESSGGLDAADEDSRSPSLSSGMAGIEDHCQQQAPSVSSINSSSSSSRDRSVPASPQSETMDISE